MEINWFLVDKIIAQGLEEDLGTGDLTSNSIIPPEAATKAIIHAKEVGVVAGIQVARRVFTSLDPGISFFPRVKDGQQVEKGTILAEVEGKARVILMGERLALNLLQRLSGIATRTASLVSLVGDKNTRIVDTRKTTPGLRILEKYAVRVGGGHNHRFGLYDAVMIKDNHIKVAGGIAQAVELARKNNPHTVKIEVEVEDLAGVEAALAVKADIIMLDNMNIESMKKAVDLIAGRTLVEASGNMTEERIPEVVQTGVDIISVGALTHSIKALDISLDLGSIKGRA